MTPNFIFFAVVFSAKLTDFMVLSMTGFGSKDLSKNGFTVEVEIKCLNSKFLDLSLRAPRAINSKEAEIRNLINQKLIRGKVNLSVEWRETNSGGAKAKIDFDLLKEYYQDLKKAHDSVSGMESDLFKIALGMPDVVRTEEEEKGEEKWNLTFQAIQKALLAVVEFREKEGEKLSIQLSSGLKEIRNTLEEIRALAGERESKQREKLLSGLEEWKEKLKIDQNRFEQELIFYLEKLDIEEEMVRLDSHLQYFDEVLDGESNGKRLNFISQEMGREINTIGAKANHAGIQKLVVNMKEELEKIREQVQNII
jgi:uncharacterized protein (TIGR00255 family)